MVATRRSTRVGSPAKTDQPADAQETPSTGRRTRRTARLEEASNQQTPSATCSKLDKSDVEPSLPGPVSTKKRCSRASRLHSPELPCTPVGSDMSDLESRESAVSESAMRTRRSKKVDENVSEVESCCSAVSGIATRRSTRRQTPQVKTGAQAESAIESCSSEVSESQRVTRSNKKTPRTRSASKRHTEDSELSETDTSIRRSSRRILRQRIVPLLLDELSESSQSPCRTSQRIRAAREREKAPVSEPPSCESEGFECEAPKSAATPRRTRRCNDAPKTLDSDSDLTDALPSVDTTPSSSEGAAASSRAANEQSAVIENPEASEHEESLLDNTVVEAEDADLTLVEEKETEVCEENSDANLSFKEANPEEISEDKIQVSPSKQVCSQAAVITVDQQEELSTDSNDRNASGMETMQETLQPSEPAGPSPSVTVTICENVSETEEQEAAAADFLSAADTSLNEDTDAEPRSEDEEESVLKPEAQQVSDLVLQPPEDVVQGSNIFSLLNSSDDESVDEEEDEDRFVEEEFEPREEKPGPSKPEIASVDGLFMIDTRPGEETANEYYIEEHPQEEEEEEEFVDEEDEDNDEDAKILFSGRDAHMKELSSRIDPGISVKELGGLYISFDGSKSNPVSLQRQKIREKKLQDEVMKKSVIGPDFEKKDAVPPYSESKQALKLKRRAEREKSTGDGWFNMKAPELNEELKGDLQVLKMRRSLDPKRFYKKNDRDGFPKYFQFGTVVDNPVDFYHSRVPKKQRKRTMVEELLADADFRHQNKKRFQNIMAEKAALGAGKRHKKKKKFHKTS